MYLVQQSCGACGADFPVMCLLCADFPVMCLQMGRVDLSNAAKGSHWEGLWHTLMIGSAGLSTHFQSYDVDGNKAETVPVRVAANQWFGELIPAGKGALLVGTLLSPTRETYPAIDYVLSGDTAGVVQPTLLLSLKVCRRASNMLSEADGFRVECCCCPVWW